MCFPLFHTNTQYLYSGFMLRKIIHIDMDAFFASVEQRDFPELRGKPVAVGGKGRRGVVAAASYEARKFGVRSAMPGFKAQQLCPDLIFVHHRFDVYKQVSTQIHDIFRQYTDSIEPLSLDEAYLDVTQNKPGIELATDIAKAIKQQIKENTQLTASAGVSFNKFLAKIASGWKKPDGLTIITPAKAEAFIEQLPIEKFYGIGKVTSDRMKSMGIRTGLDLKQLTEEELITVFGDKSGKYYYRIARAIDDRPVEAERIRKSLGAEETFEEDLSDVNEMRLQLEGIAEEVSSRCEKHGIAGRTVTLKIKYNDFTQHTRSKSFFHFISSQQELTDIAFDLLQQHSEMQLPVRLLGITLSNLNNDDEPVKEPRSVYTQLKLSIDSD